MEEISKAKTEEESWNEAFKYNELKQKLPTKKKTRSLGKQNKLLFIRIVSRQLRLDMYFMS
jgi:hypothetical protein